MQHWVKAIWESELPTLTTFLLIAIAKYVDFNDISVECYPSVERLQRDTRMSKRSVAEHTTAAVRAGFLRVRKGAPPANGRRLSQRKYHINYYTALIPATSKPDAPDAPSSNVKPSAPAAPSSTNQVREMTKPCAPNDRNQVRQVSPTLPDTYSSTHARSRAPKDEVVNAISKKWIRIFRQDAAFSRWEKHLETHDPALRDKLRASHVFYIYVPSLEPSPGCPLPTLPSPQRADNLSAGSGAERPRSRD